MQELGRGPALWQADVDLEPVVGFVQLVDAQRDREGTDATEGRPNALDRSSG